MINCECEFITNDSFKIRYFQQVGIAIVLNVKKNMFCFRSEWPNVGRGHTIIMTSHASNLHIIVCMYIMPYDLLWATELLK